MTILNYLREFTILSFFLFSAWGFGSLIFRVIKVKRLPAIEHPCRIAAGMGVMAHITLVVGLLWAIKPIMAIGLLSTGLLLALFFTLTQSDLSKWLSNITTIKLSRFDEILIFSLLIASSFYPLIRNTFIPPLSYDEIAYHLPIPKIFIEQGKISYISFIPYSNWPLEIEMLFMLGLLLGSETFSHLLTWSALLLLCWGLYSLGSYFFSRRAGLIAATLFAQTPMVAAIAGTGLIEIPLTFYTFLGVSTLLIWYQEPQTNTWILSAIMAGLAASTKFNAAVFAAILAAFFAFAFFYGKERARILQAASKAVVYGLIAFAIVSPWYLKSWLQTGNPLWGFFMNVFPTRDWDYRGSKELLKFIRGPNLPFTPYNFGYLFWVISVNYSKIGPWSFRLGWVHLAALFTIPAGLKYYKGRQRRFIFLLLILSGVLYVNWFFQTHQARFFMPVVPILSLALCTGIDTMLDKQNNSVHWFTFIAFLGAVVTNSWIFQPTERILLKNNSYFLAGRQSKEQFLATHISGYEVITYANQHLPSNAIVLLALWESRGYYLERPYIWLNPIGQRIIRLEELENAKQLAIILQRLGITHIIHNPKVTERFMNIDFGPHQARLMADLLAAESRLLYASGEMELYQFSPSIELAYP